MSDKQNVKKNVSKEDVDAMIKKAEDVKEKYNILLDKINKIEHIDKVKNFVQSYSDIDKTFVNKYNNGKNTFVFFPNLTDDIGVYSDKDFHTKMREISKTLFPIGIIKDGNNKDVDDTESNSIIKAIDNIKTTYQKTIDNIKGSIAFMNMAVISMTDQSFIMNAVASYNFEEQATNKHNIYDNVDGMYRAIYETFHNAYGQRNYDKIVNDVKNEANNVYTIADYKIDDLIDNVISRYKYIDSNSIKILKAKYEHNVRIDNPKNSNSKSDEHNSLKIPTQKSVLGINTHVLDINESVSSSPLKSRLTKSPSQKGKGYDKLFRGELDAFKIVDSYDFALGKLLETIDKYNDTINKYTLHKSYESYVMQTNKTDVYKYIEIHMIKYYRDLIQTVMEKKNKKMEDTFSMTMTFMCTLLDNLHKKMVDHKGFLLSIDSVENELYTLLKIFSYFSKVLDTYCYANIKTPMCVKWNNSNIIVNNVDEIISRNGLIVPLFIKKIINPEKTTHIYLNDVKIINDNLFEWLIEPTHMLDFDNTEILFIKGNDIELYNPRIANNEVRFIKGTHGNKFIDIINNIQKYRNEYSFIKIIIDNICRENVTNLTIKLTIITYDNKEPQGIILYMMTKVSNDEIVKKMNDSNDTNDKSINKLCILY